MRHLYPVSGLLILLCLGSCSDPARVENRSPLDRVEYTTDKSTYELGEPIQFEFANRSSEAIYYRAFLSCPSRLLRKDGEVWVEHQIGDDYICTADASFRRLEPSGVLTTTLSSERSTEWLIPGTYRTGMWISEEDMVREIQTIYTATFEITDSSMVLVGPSE